MTDGGVFEGLDSVGTSRLNRLEQVGLTFCPDATCNFKRVSVTNKANKPDFVLAIRVLYHQSRLVRTTKGMAFIRVGDSIHKLKSEEVRELQANKGEISFEREPCGLSYPQDFTGQMIREFREPRKKKEGLESRTLRRRCSVAHETRHS